jgi:hypothetical protein
MYCYLVIYIVVVIEIFVVVCSSEIKTCRSVVVKIGFCDLGKVNS